MNCSVKELCWNRSHVSSYERHQNIGIFDPFSVPLPFNALDPPSLSITSKIHQTFNLQQNSQLFQINHSKINRI